VDGSGEKRGENLSEECEKRPRWTRVVARVGVSKIRRV
jgi:hypothetical protein